MVRIILVTSATCSVDGETNKNNQSL